MPGWDIYWWHYLDSYLYLPATLHITFVFDCSWLIAYKCLSIAKWIAKARELCYSVLSSWNIPFVLFILFVFSNIPTPILITHPVIGSSSHPSWPSVSFRLPAPGSRLLHFRLPPLRIPCHFIDTLAQIFGMSPERCRPQDTWGTRFKVGFHCFDSGIPLKDLYNYWKLLKIHGKTIKIF